MEQFNWRGLHRIVVPVGVLWGYGLSDLSDLSEILAAFVKHSLEILPNLFN